MESNTYVRSCIGAAFLEVAVAVILFSAPPAGAEQQAAAKLNPVAASGAVNDLKIFSGEKRLFASYGPSTTVGYPARLQRKFYRYTGKNGADCPLQIHNYSIGGAQWRMPGWINCCQRRLGGHGQVQGHCLGERWPSSHSARR